jgi:ABC-type glycerol-3-phosphate transport system substrate-binding protein
MSKFQVITIAVFIIFIVTGVAFFATYKGSGGADSNIPEITIWGTFPGEVFDEYLAEINLSRPSSLSIHYVEKNQNSFSQEFIAALARGRGPDAILIPADMLLPHLDKITTIPYSVLPQRTFKDTYIEEGEIYLTTEGARAIPFVIDPLIMYWNRDSFAGAGLAGYPKTWSDFTDVNTKLTAKDENGNIRKSAIALGDFTNVANAREILGALIMQMGNTITSENTTDGLKSTLKSGPSPEVALQFFTQFVNPNSSLYAWNRGLPASRTAFLSGTLATYFGFASEIKDLRDRNPNLNFDAAPLPQLKSGGVKSTYGKMYGLSILKSSANQNASFQDFAILTDASFLKGLSDKMYLPSVRRDIIAQGSTDAYITIFNQVALISRTWLDADPAKSFTVFANMVNAITSGAKSIREAINDASDQYDVILQQAIQ